MCYKPIKSLYSSFYLMHKIERKTLHRNANLVKKYCTEVFMT